jgi:hypothetical protein
MVLLETAFPHKSVFCPDYLGHYSNQTLERTFSSNLKLLDLVRGPFRLMFKLLVSII